MGRLLRVLIGILVILILSMSLANDPASAVSAADCSTGDIFTTCPKKVVSARTNSGEVELHARSSYRSSSTAQNRVLPTKHEAAPTHSLSVSALSDKEVQALQIAPCADVTICSTQKNNGINTLLINDPSPVDPVQPADPAAPARVVTAADVERFLPVVGELHAEPDGWAVVGVPANFWTEARPVVVQGELLGEAADVRFTPRGYRWDYGDGTTRVTRTGGTSWADAGQEELTATPTSHRYLQKAAVDVSVSTIWSAEYRIADGDWVDVVGAVASIAPRVPTIVVRERTVLTGD